MTTVPRTLSGGARLAGVLGWPVSHSRSPRLHGYWLAEHGIDGAYLPLAVRPEHLARALEALPLLGFRGANITVPHKEAALALVDRASDEARRIGAVNTIVVDPDGRLDGRNTDGQGFLASLAAALPAWRADRGPAVLLGAGGAARAIAVALIDAGVPEIRLINRTAARAARLAGELGGPLRSMPWEQRNAALAGAAMLINGTSLGMAGHQALDLELGRLPASAIVSDVVYTPLETPLLAAARARGNPVVDGLGMLLNQARAGFAAWFGVEPEITAALRRFVMEDG